MLGQNQRIIYFDTKVPDGTFDLGVAKQKLYRTEVVGSAVDQGGFCPSQRVCSVFCVIDADFANPAVDDPSVLAGSEMARHTGASREQVVIRCKL